MKITRLSCQGCGAPLEASASFVTCLYCRTRAETVPDQIQVRAIEILSAQNQRLELEVTEQRLREDLRRLESSWIEIRGKYLISDGCGNWMNPCVSSIGVGLFTGGLGAIFTWRAAEQGSFYWIPALVMALIGARIAVSAWRRHAEFDRSQKSYLRQRLALVTRIREASHLRRLAM